MSNHFAVPAPSSLERFRDIFSSAPMTLDVNKFAIRLGESSSANVAGGKFSAKIVWVGHLHNEELDYSEWVAEVSSPELLARAKELGSSDEFKLLLVLQSPASPLARTNKAWIVSIHNILVAKEGLFEFVERAV